MVKSHSWDCMRSATSSSGTPECSISQSARESRPIMTSLCNYSGHRQDHLTTRFCSRTRTTSRAVTQQRQGAMHSIASEDGRMRLGGTARACLVLSLALAGVFGVSACAGWTPPPTWSMQQPTTRRDSILQTAVQLGRLVNLVDEYARPLGLLPVSLEPVLRNSQEPSGRDVWGRELRYSAAGLRYELRAAGPDGAFETSDDIVSLGRLGRAIPCETRHGLGIMHFENAAPACAEEPLLLVPLCPALLAEELDGGDKFVTDTALVTGLNLVRLARQVDGYGRTIGTLPLNLRQVISNREILDAWGRAVQYSRRVHEFEVRSAGRDGVDLTGDDIRVASTLGLPIPCVFSAGGTRTTCPDPAPACPN
jgi:hypothetical protein